MSKSFLCGGLISQTLVAGGKVDNPAIGKAVLRDVVLHDPVVPMCIDADVGIMGETESYDVAEDTMSIGITGDAVDDMIG